MENSPVSAGEGMNDVNSDNVNIPSFSACVTDRTLTLRIVTVSIDRHVLAIYDVLGRRVLQLQCDGSIVLENLSALSSGSYFVTLNDGLSSAEKIYDR